jgi:dethiobiotin synthetase
LVPGPKNCHPKKKKNQKKKKNMAPEKNRGGKVTRLMILGHASTAGKTTVCLGLLSAALARLPANRIAYIKPVTQCEDPGPAAALAHERGVAGRDPHESADTPATPSSHLGPVVFYSGMTRAVLDGKVTRDLMAEAVARIEAAAAQVEDATEAGLDGDDGDKVDAGDDADPVFGSGLVLVDGVGYPAVGSIAGVGGADLARRARCSVLIVGKKGVGDAVDNYVLMSEFCRARGARVIGAIFNRLAPDGFYGREQCAEYVGKWFAAARRDGSERAFGFLEERDDHDALMDRPCKGRPGPDTAALDAWFAARVDIAGIFAAAAGDGAGDYAGVGAGDGAECDAQSNDGARGVRRVRTGLSTRPVVVAADPSAPSLSRQEIEAAAIEDGAPGCQLRRRPAKRAKMADGAEKS